MILAGDVGGTKTALGLFEERDGALELRVEATYQSRDHASLREILERFLRDATPRDLEAACFGVPGVVRDGRANATNLPWQLDERELADAFGFPRVRFLNDLEATAHGMLLLPRDELAVLNDGEALGRPSHRAVIAAGTGLGEAMLIWTGDRHMVVASEGGHADFAARTDREIALLQFLRAELGHVSYERVLTGSGLHAVYRFLRRRHGGPEPGWLSDRLAREDPAAVVSELGLAARDPVCVEALDLFAEAYGAEAGNLALRCLAVDGVYVGGGIAAKILPALQRGGFMRAFTDKGRYAKLLEAIPVRVSLNPRTALLGAADRARHL